MGIEIIGVIGAGQMGSGIAEVALTTGLRVVMRDVTPEALKRGEERIRKDLQRRVDKGKMRSDEKSEILERLSATIQLGDLEVCDFLVEAATERVALKEEIFKGLDEIAPKDVILASNTSSISITRIASFTARPDRVIGMHFFNPVPVMNLIEIVRGMETSDETYMTTRTLSERLDKTPLEAKDMPGFVSSRLIFSYMNEAIYTLYEGVGSREDIDAIMKMGANHPMGPLALADFVGLDTVLSVMEILQEAFGDKYRPCPLLVKYVEAGRLGVKSGRGFYDHGEKR
jgi:3-hydroxybutyryl-CoA dehydrogenase